MEFSIGTEELQKIMKLMGVVAKANAADSSGRLLIDAQEDHVEILSNNGSTALYYDSYETKVVEPGVVSFNYSKIKSFVSSFKIWNGTAGAKSFTFKATDKATTITVDNIYENGKVSKGKLRLANFNPALINRLPKFKKADFILNSTIFRAATSKVLYAINPNMDYSLNALQGMNISFDDDQIYFVGSDSRVLSEYMVKNVSDRAEGNVTLQYDFIMGLRRLLVDDLQLFWEIDGHRVAVKCNDMVFIGRCIIGHEYPDYKNALDAYQDRINIRKDVFMDLLLPFTDILDAEDNFRLTFAIKDKTIKVFNDQANFELDQDIAGGLDFAIDLNGRLLMQTVDAIKDDHILLKFTDENKVIIFDSCTFEDQKALITPLKRR
jgi:DNA polymerase III sliding clamp (beta) subunit (PCNA family)